MRSWPVWCAILVLLVLVLAPWGCGKATDSDAPASASGDDDKAAARDLARKFGEAIVKGDWTAALALGSNSLRSRVSVEAMRKKYDDFIAVRKGPPYNFAGLVPDSVETGSGSLPGSPEEAREVYHIDSDAPQASWRAWVFCILRQKQPELGLEARLFVVEEGGALRIAYVEFGFIS